MKKVSSVAVLLALAGLMAGCGTTRARSRAVTPLPRVIVGTEQPAPATTVSGPVNVTGPVTVSGPVTVVQPTKQEAAPERAVAPTRAISSAPISGAPSVAAANSSGNSAEVELKKEQMSVEKQVVPNGEAVLRKTVTQQQVSQPTPLNVEDVVLERTPASGQPTTQFGEVVATIPLQREQAAGVITPVVKEIVRVKKVTNTINTNVVGVVRDEQATLTNNKIQ